VSVLSGNRNFEGRIHPLVACELSASPLLVVAYALAGRIGRGHRSDAIGDDREGNPVLPAHIGRRPLRSNSRARGGEKRQMYSKRVRRSGFAATIAGARCPYPEGNLYDWNSESTYIRGRRSSTAMPQSARAAGGYSQRARAGRCSAQRDNGSHFAGRLDSTGRPGGALPDRGSACGRWILIPTARGAEIMK